MHLEDARRHLQDWIDNSITRKHSWASFSFGWSIVSQIPDKEEQAYWGMKRKLLTSTSRAEREDIARGDDLMAQAARELVADVQRLTLEAYPSAGSATR